MKQIKRAKLTDALQGLTLKPDLFFVTSFRATKDNSIQVEVCQNRRIGGRKRTLLGMVNRSDKRFGQDTTLVFDWMKFEPEDLLATFPTLTTGENAITVEELKAMAETYDPQGETGTNALVYQSIHAVPYIVDVNSEEKVKPVISVTEVTHSQLVNYEFYKGENADEKISNEIENGRAIMKTSSQEDADFIVDSETGDKIYRFTRTVISEDYPNGDWDSIIPNKVASAAYNKSVRNSAKKSYDNAEKLIVGEDDKL